MTTVDNVAVGNELLLGDVPDTNTNWLCKRIRGFAHESYDFKRGSTD